MASTDELHDPAFEVPAGYVGDLFRLDGRAAVVTGGGSGLGAAMAKGLAQAGAAAALRCIRALRAPASREATREQRRRRSTLPRRPTGQQDAHPPADGFRPGPRTPPAPL